MNKIATAEQHKRRILDVVNNLNDDELEKVGELLSVAGALQSDIDAASAVAANELLDIVVEGDEVENYNGGLVEEYDDVDELPVRV